jgi:hypothetical protein
MDPIANAVGQLASMAMHIIGQMLQLFMSVMAFFATIAQTLLNVFRLE